MTEIKRKRKLFYNLSDGAKIQEVDGDIVYPGTRETTVDEAFIYYGKLAERVKDTVGLLELEYDDYLQDFREGKWTGVDLESMTPTFIYPDPSSPETPTEPQLPISAQIAELKTETAALNLAIIDVWETLAGGGA